MFLGRPSWCLPSSLPVVTLAQVCLFLGSVLRDLMTDAVALRTPSGDAFCCGLRERDVSLEEGFAFHPWKDTQSSNWRCDGIALSVRLNVCLTPYLTLRRVCVSPWEVTERNLVPVWQCHLVRTIPRARVMCALWSVGLQCIRAFVYFCDPWGLFCLRIFLIFQRGHLCNLV